VELHAAVAVLGEDAVGQPAVEMGRELQDGPVALAKGDGAGQWLCDASTSRLEPLPGEDRAQEERQDVADALLVVADSQPNIVGQREGPLAVGRHGQNVVDQMGGAICHASGKTRAANGATLA